MSDNAYRILVLVLLVLILIAVVADVTMQLVRGGDGNSHIRGGAFGLGGPGQGDRRQPDQQQREQGSGLLPALEFSAG